MLSFYFFLFWPQCCVWTLDVRFLAIVNVLYVCIMKHCLLHVLNKTWRSYLHKKKNNFWTCLLPWEWKYVGIFVVLSSVLLRHKYKNHKSCNWTCNCHQLTLHSLGTAFIIMEATKTAFIRWLYTSAVINFWEIDLSKFSFSFSSPNYVS